MITAVCLNPCLDQTLRLERLTPGGTNRLLGQRTTPGGKGINVARTLAALGTPVRLAGLLPRENSGPLTQALPGVECRWLPLDGALRTNLKILDEEKGQITEINAKGQPVTPQTLEAMEAVILAAARDSEALVLTGSTPPGCPADYYARLIARLGREVPGCAAILDAEGEAFRLGVAAKPAFVKPNRHELSLYAGRALNDLGALLSAARGLVAAGVGAVLVSMDTDGALFVDDRGAWFAPAAKVKVVTTVGAGDAMVAAYAAARSRGLSGGDAFSQAVACAAARVAGEDGQMEKYQSLVQRKELAL